VLEPVVVERFRCDRVDAETSDLGGEHTRVGANVRVRRAEVGDVGVAERVFRRAIRKRVGERSVVEEHGPCVYLNAALPRPCDQLRQGVGGFADGRSKANVAPARGVRSEEDRAALEEAHLASRIVRKDVAALVVRRRHGDAVEPGAVLDVVEHDVDALVFDVGGEGEDRGSHRAG
jgi:hypothetical protein